VFKRTRYLPQQGCKLKKIKKHPFKECGKDIIILRGRDATV